MMDSRALMNAVTHPDLTPNQRLLYAYLLFRANGAWITWPTVPEMMAHLHIRDRHVVMAATKRMVELGLIEVSRQTKQANVYRILNVPGLFAMPNWTSAAPIVNETDTAGPSDVQESYTSDVVQESCTSGGGDVQENHQSDVQDSCTPLSTQASNYTSQGESADADSARASQPSAEEMFDIDAGNPATATDPPHGQDGLLHDVEDEPPPGTVQNGLPMTTVVATKGEPRSRPRPVAADDPTFAAFWTLYPRKKEKIRALRDWNKAIGKVAPEAIVAALRAQMASGMFEDERGLTFIKYPTTWLAKGCWDDAIEPPRPARPSNSPMTDLMRKFAREREDAERRAGMRVASPIEIEHSSGDPRGQSPVQQRAKAS